MYCLRLIVLFGVYTAASLIGELLAAQYELAKPVVNHAVPIARHPAPDFGIFRRQGNCPILTLVCPAGNCCSYSTPCCGNTCCDSNSVCAGTSSGGSPCCVAIGDLTNTCGSSTKDVSEAVLSSHQQKLKKDIAVRQLSRDCNVL